jgi:hypothetical protein
MNPLFMHRACGGVRALRGAGLAALAGGLMGTGLKGKEEEVPALSQGGVQAAFQILRQDYIRSGELGFEQLNRAALEGLLRQLRAGAKVVPTGPAQKVDLPPRVYGGVLVEKIGWVRPTTFAVAEVDAMTEQLRSLQKAGCEAVLLDLRHPAGAASFEVAAQMLEAFVPPGKTLFRLKQAGKAPEELSISSKEPVWTGRTVVLIDGQTNNVGEVIAGVLRQMRLAVLVGEATQGATVRYERLPLDSHYTLQYASAELLLPDGGSLFQKGLEPDLKVVMPEAARRQAQERMAQGRVRELVHETARVRFNEASLVAGRNPELESYLKRSLNEGREDESPPDIDPVLQRAVDLLQSHARLEAFKLNWGSAPPADDGEKLKARKAIPVSGR